MKTLICSIMLTGLGAIGLPGVTAAQSRPPDSADPVVKVTRLANRRALVEVQAPGVSIRKDVGPDASHATITTPTDELHLRVTRGVLTVSSPGGTVTLAEPTREDATRLLALLNDSEAAARGRAVLKRLAPAADPFVHQTLLLTRVVLEMGQGRSPALTAHHEWVQGQGRRLASAPAARPITKVSWQSGGSDRGPGECWDAYAKEAIRIANDFADCTGHLKWYDGPGWTACSIIYVVRAEMAFAWLVACSGGFPFSG